MSQRYVVQKPEFINVPAGVLEDLSDQGTDKSVLEAEDAAMGEQADYQVVNVLLILWRPGERREGIGYKRPGRSVRGPQ